MNAIEKIIAAHGNEKSVKPGQIVDVALDYVMSNDACTNLAIDVFRSELKASKVLDPAKVIFVLDHYTPSSSIDAADTHNKMRAFAREQQLKYVYDGIGVCHQLMMEHHVSPGQMVIGADSHTCTYGAMGALSTGMGSTDIAIAWMQGHTWIKVPQTIRITVTGQWPKGVYAKDLILKIIGDITTKGATYKAMQFDGSAIQALNMSERSTICNMAIEAGAKFAYIQPDAITQAYMESMGRPDYPVFADDQNAQFEKALTYDVSNLVPQIAFPHSVDNVQDISAFEGMAIDEIFVGACTNGRYEDLAITASILKGKKVASTTRLLITPASKNIYLRAIRDGLIETLVESGAIISNPGCSACFGGSGGILGKSEKLLTTANRNFRARVGSPDSEIYLASPAVAAASAIYGKITDPRRII